MDDGSNVAGISHAMMAELYALPGQVVQLDGALRPGVTAKDVVLHLLAMPELRAGGGLGRVFEFGGAVVAGLSTDERATLTNMTAELGGLTGIVEPDEETVRFLRERRGASFQVEPWMRSDAGAGYERVIAIDCGELGPMLAAPGDPGNGIAVEHLGHRARIESLRRDRNLSGHEC